MGMCKECGEVVGTIEMIDGYCKECSDPKIREERRAANLLKQKLKQQEEEIARKKRLEEKRIIAEKRNSIFLTTETTINLEIDKRISLISAECIYGVNIVKDFFSGIRDIVGGNVQSLEKSLKKAKNKVTVDLKEQAYKLGGDAVIGVRIEHSYNNAGGGSIMSVFATGTVVTLKKPKIQKE